jgi:hypothetical protein
MAATMAGATTGNKKDLTVKDKDKNGKNGTNI